MLYTTNPIIKHKVGLPNLAINNIEHTKKKSMSPQINGICERFHKILLNEFYKVTFRKKLYDEMIHYNRILMNDLLTIIMSEPIWEKWVVAARR